MSGHVTTTRRPRRRYIIVLTERETARLQTYDGGRRGTRWLDEPRLRRQDSSTLVVDSWSRMGLASAYVTTRGTATLHADGTLAVDIRYRARWLGWSLVAIGLLCGATVAWRGWGAVALGAAFAGLGWYLFLQPSGQTAELDEVEDVLRSSLRGEWTPIPED